MDNKDKQISFSNYIDTYEREIQSSIGFIGQDHDFFIKVKADLIIAIASENFSRHEDIDILDIGSGIGLIDHYLGTVFKNLHGVDIENSVVEKARTFNPNVRYSLYDGISLPFNDNSMDLVFAINVMHHVPPGNWGGFTKEMARVLRNAGTAVVFEHNPLNPLTRLAVDRCEFDRDAVLLHKNKLRKLFIDSKFEKINTSYILFFPVRKKIFRSLEKLIGWLPLGAQFYITGKKGT